MLVSLSPLNSSFKMFNCSASFTVAILTIITPHQIPICQVLLTSKQLAKPAPFLLWRLVLLIRSGLPGKKLLLDRPRVKSLGRCRRLLGSGQRISEPSNGLSLLLDLPVFHFKLPLQCVDGGL